MLPIRVRYARLFAIALVGCFAAVPGPSRAQIYSGIGGDGAIVLSNFRSSQAPQLIVGVPSPDAIRPGPRSSAYGDLIERAALDTGLSPHLLHAVIATESGYDSRAVSPKGAQGLMQLMPATARQLGVVDPFDPAQNVAAGANYLRSLLDRFTSLELALAAYNAGPEAVAKAGNRIPAFAETRAYVPRVITRMQKAVADDGVLPDARVAARPVARAGP